MTAAVTGFYFCNCVDDVHALTDFAEHGITEITAAMIQEVIAIQIDEELGGRTVNHTRARHCQCPAIVLFTVVGLVQSTQQRGRIGAGNPDDPDLLVASAGGQPVLKADGIFVEPLIHFDEVSMATGKSLAYALFNLQERGRLFIGHATDVYEGMVIGIHARGNDLSVNPLKAKQLTNIRAAGSDENILLTPPVRLTLEYALEFIDDDELVEVTPKSIRIRKKLLREHDRKRASRAA